MRAIVLAGGLGTRLAGITVEIPKPMAPVGPRPFLEYLLDYLIEQDTCGVILAVSYKWEVIQDHFGCMYRGLPLAYSVESEPLGTGGAIKQALDISHDEEVVVLNGDTLFRIDLQELADSHRASGARLSIALKHVTDRGRFGGIDVSPDGVVVNFLEKAGGGPGWINGGIYMLNRRLFADFQMPARFSFEQDLVEPNLDRIRPFAFMSNAYFIDMGIPEDYERAQRQIGTE